MVKELALAATVAGIPATQSELTIVVRVTSRSVKEVFVPTVHNVLVNPKAVLTAVTKLSRVAPVIPAFPPIIAGTPTALVVGV